MGEESIYDLLPTVRQPEAKNPRYKSVFNETTKAEYKSHKQASKTMGPAKVPLNEPSSFMSKRAKEPVLPEKSQFVRPNADQKRPAVPKRDEKPVMGLKSNKNFIHTNAVENIMSVAKKPQPKYVDTPGGTTNNLDDSGLVPKFVKKENYGTVPKYLEARKKQMAEHQKNYEQYIQQRLQKGALNQISAEERQKNARRIEKELGRTTSSIPRTFSRHRYSTEESKERKNGS